MTTLISPEPAQHAAVEARAIRRNLPAAILYEEAARRREGLIGRTGPLVVRTGQYTGRSPKDKFVVREPGSAERIWWGSVNQPYEAERFAALHERLRDYIRDQIGRASCRERV